MLISVPNSSATSELTSDYSNIKSETNEDFVAEASRISFITVGIVISEGIFTYINIRLIYRIVK